MPFWLYRMGITNYQKFGFIAGQIFSGACFGILGFILFIILGFLISNLSGYNFDVFGSMASGYIGCYLGMLAGVWYSSYNFLKQIDRHKEILKFVLQSILGLTVSLAFIFYLANYLTLPEGSFILVNWLSFLIPLTSTILGFNFRIFKQKSQA